MTDELSRSEVITRRFELDEQISIIQGRHKLELAPLVEELSMCERFVADSMNKANDQSVKIDGVGMTYFTSKSKCQVRDWDATLAKIQAEGLWHLLTHAVSKEAMKEYIETNKESPPGVEFTTFKDLSWRRG